MPVTKRPPNPLRAAILKTAQQFDAPKLDRTPTEAALRGFLASILGGPVADTVAPAAEDEAMMATMPAMGMAANVGRKIHPLLKNHSPEQLKRMIDQGYDVENVLLHGTPKRHSTSPPDYALDSWGMQLDPNGPKGFAYIKPSERGLHGPGIYTTTSPEIAAAYATHGTTYPVVARGRVSQLYADETADILEALVPKATTVFPRIRQDGITRVIRDPKNIRSIFAEFDPAKMDLKDLMASILGLGTAGTLLPRNRE